MIDHEDDFFESAPRMMPGPGPTFEAEYESTCSELEDDIQPGDSIRADGAGGYAHASCLRQASRPVIWE